MEKYPELLRELLIKRGITGESEADIFLSPDYKRDFHDPYLMRDMEKACVRIYEAMENDEKIIIYADYDCDGIPGAVILTDLFKKAGFANYQVYIPQRNSEGYGLHTPAIKEFGAMGAKLIITIDLGITAVQEVAQAEVLDIDVIITDHHLPPEVLPKAFAILNPKTDDYPEKMLCGAGVAFKLAQGFIKKYGEYYKIKEGAEKWMLDMAGLATLSDMVPLVGENRAIVYFGMMVLRKSPRPGLQKLLTKMNIDQRYLTEDDIGFMLTPRLNAASRMSDPMRAYELLSGDDEIQAGVLAKHLTDINDERKVIVAGIMREVNKKMETRIPRQVVLVGDPSWRVGVLGLVAGKLCDQYKKPVFVWGRDENGMIKGSCRSDGSVSVVELMNAAGEHFLEFGGHAGAGGFSVHNEKIHFLEDALAESFGKVKKSDTDDVLDESHYMTTALDCVCNKNWREIARLSPFGFGNPKPSFLFSNVKIENIKKFGKKGSGEHLEIICADGTGRAKAISFFSTEDSFKSPILVGAVVNLLATFDLSRFRGREELRLRIIDIL